jgi:Holliday junction DNA helicase RuvA
VGGVTYKVHLSVQCSAAIETQEVALHISNIIREDANLFFGFLDSGEQEVFERVLKISGVGPSTALAICSTFTPEQFLSIVRGDDVNTLKSVPGIGPKSAKRILVELGDFELGSVSGDSTITLLHEATLALESLGFKKEKIVPVLKQCQANDISSLVKEALKKIR